MIRKKNMETSARKLVAYLLEAGLGGFGPLSSAEDLATEYLIDQSYVSHDQRVRSLINWETGKNFTSGFVTGLGGFITFPVSIPTALGASWLLQARLAGSIARIYGHNLDSDRVRTAILLSLAGDSAKNAIKDAGVQLGRQLAQQAINQIPGRALVEINKTIGFRLVTKAGERGILNLSKGIPVAGGFVGGTMDVLACRVVGRTAKTLFRPVESAGAKIREAP